MEINKELEAKCDDIIARYPQKRSAAMMIMHLIQETFGHFDDTSICFAANKLGVEPIEVYGMLSFYPMYSQKPRGRVHIKVCRTLSCALSGSIKLGNELSRLLECPMGETRGIYTIEFVECLGNCSHGANVQVNDRLFEKVVAEDAEKFVEKIKSMDAEGALNPVSTSEKPQGNSDFSSPSYMG